jgi:WD40 repeat protein
MRSIGVLFLLMCVWMSSESVSSQLPARTAEIELVSRLGYGEFNKMVYDPSRALAYIASASGLLLWDQQYPDTVSELLEIPEGGVLYVTALNPTNETLLLGLRNGTILSYSVATQQTVELVKVEGLIVSMSVSYDEKLLAIYAKKGELLLFNLLTHELTAFLNSMEGPATFSPTEPLLIARSDSNLIGWNYESGTRSTIAIPNLDELIMDIAFSDDGQQFAIGIRDGNIHLWNAETLQLINSIEPFDCCIGAIRFDPSGTHIIASYSDGVVIWSLVTGEMAYTFPPQAMTDVAFLSDASAVVLLRFDTLQVWNEGAVNPSLEVVNSSPIYEPIQIINEQVTFLSREPDGEITLRFVDQPDQIGQVRLPNDGRLEAIRIAPIGTELAYWTKPDSLPQNTSYVHRVDWTSGRDIEQYTLAFANVNDLQYATLSNQLAVGGVINSLENGNEGRIIIVSDDAAAPEVIASDGMLPVTAVHWLEDDTKLLSIHASISTHGIITLWDMSTRSPITNTSIPTYALDHAISEDDAVLAVITPIDTLHVSYLPALIRVADINVPADLTSVGVSEEHDIVVVGTRDGSLMAYDYDGNLLVDFKGHNGRVLDVAFKGTYMITLSQDNTVKVWQITSS